MKMERNALNMKFAKMDNFDLILIKNAFLIVNQLKKVSIMKLFVFIKMHMVIVKLNNANIAIIVTFVLEKKKAIALALILLLNKLLQIVFKFVRI